MAVERAGKAFAWTLPDRNYAATDLPGGPIGLRALALEKPIGLNGIDLFWRY